jgi:hypothetical protein
MDNTVVKENSAVVEREIPGYLKEKNLIRKVSSKVKKELNLDVLNEDLTDCLYGVLKECMAENLAFMYFQPEKYEEFTLPHGISLDMMLLNLKDYEARRNFEKLVEFFFKVKWLRIASKTRKREIVIPRQFVETWLVDNTTWSLKEVGAFMGNRDHSTVIHSSMAVRDSISVDRKQLNYWNNFNEFLNVYIKPDTSERLGQPHHRARK